MPHNNDKQEGRKLRKKVIGAALTSWHIVGCQLSEGAFLWERSGCKSLEMSLETEVTVA